VKEEEQIRPEIRQFITNIEGGYISVFGEKLKKLTLRSPYDVYTVREAFSTTYEADILFPIRYLIDRVEKIEPQEYRIMIIDIETTTTYGFPKEDNPLENITVLTYYDNYKDTLTTLVYRPDKPNEIEERKDGTIEYFNDEYSMLKYFVNQVKKIDPDILTAWNIKFDIGYLVARMKALRVDYKGLSPMRTVQKRGYDWQIKGRVVFDLLIAYKRIHLSELTSYSLASVAKDELDAEEKERIPDFTKAWKERLQELIEYNRNDVRLVKKINDKLDIISYYDQMRLTACLDNINSCFFYSRVIDTLMLRKYKDKVVFPSKPEYRPRSEEEKISGGYVMETKKGLWEDVIVIDMKGMYPSIIRTFNLSKEMVTDKKTPDTIEVNGLKIRTHKEGVIPGIINDLITLRDVYRKRLKEYAPHTNEYKILWQKSFSTKFLVNTVYGVHALTSFRMYDERIANTITFIGREIAQMNIRIAEEQGHIVIGADTDSVILKVKEGQDPIQVGEQLTKIINKKLTEYVQKYNLQKHYLKIEFEKYYKRFLAGAKKRYAGHVVWKDGKRTDLVEFAGYEVRRSDNSKVAKQIQRRILTMILKERKTEQEVFEYIEEEIEKIKNLEYDYNEIAIPVKLEKEADEYESNLPQCRASRWANKNIKTNYSAGSKFLLLYVKDPKTDVIGFDNLHQLKNYKVTLDMMKTLDTNIFMKIKRIMKVLRWDKRLDKLYEKHMLIEKNQTTINKFIEA